MADFDIIRTDKILIYWNAFNDSTIGFFHDENCDYPHYMVFGHLYICFA